MSAFCRPNRLATSSQQSRMCLSPKDSECILRLQGRNSSKVPIPLPVSSEFATFGRTVANTLSDKLLVWTPSRVLCIDVTGTKGATADQLRVPSPPHRELIQASDLLRDGDVVVDARWHPLAAHCVLVLTRARLLAFDTSAATGTPIQDIILPARGQRHGTNGQKHPVPSALGFGAARGWELLSLYVVYSDGSLFCLCPWLPPGALLFHADWALLRRDAALAVQDYENAASSAGSSMNASSSAPNAAYLHLEWLDVCFQDVHAGMRVAPAWEGTEYSGPQYKRYTGAPAKHALLGVNAKRRWVPSLQGPARLRPELPTPKHGNMAQVVDLHVYGPSVAALPMIAMLQSDGHMSIWLACSHIVPSWSAQEQSDLVQATLDAAEKAQSKSDFADQKAALHAYALRQLHVKHVAWGQQLLLPPSLSGELGRSRIDDVGRAGTSAGTWVALHAALLPLKQAPEQESEKDPDAAHLQDAAAHVGAGRGTVSGTSGQVGVASLPSVGLDGMPVQLDIVQAPSFYCTHEDWTVPGGVLVVGRHSVHLVSRPSVSLSQDELDSAAEADVEAADLSLSLTGTSRQDGEDAERSRGPLAHLRLHETPLMIIDLLQEGSSSVEEAQRDDVCGVAVVGDTVHVWTTPPGEAIHESGFKLEHTGVISSTSLVQGTVMGRSGQESGGTAGGAAQGLGSAARFGGSMLSLESLPQAKVFVEETNPFADEAAPLLQAVKRAQASLTACVVAQSAPASGGAGPVASLGTEVLERVAKTSLPLFNAMLELHKLQQAIAHRKKLLALVAEQCLTLAKAARLHSSAAESAHAVQELSDRAEAARGSMQERLVRAKAIEKRLFGDERDGSASSNLSDTSTASRTRELKAILRELNISCRTHLALLDLKVESLDDAVAACSSSANVSVAELTGQGGQLMATGGTPLEDVRAYAEAVQERIAAVSMQQEASQLAIRTLTTAVDSAARGRGSRLQGDEGPVETGLQGDLPYSYPKDADGPQKGAAARPRRFNRAGLPMSPM